LQILLLRHAFGHTTLTCRWRAHVAVHAEFSTMFGKR